MTEFQSGALVDVRLEIQRAKDFKFEEVVASSAPVDWVEKSPDQWRKFPIFNQNGSGSCVAQTEAKELGIMRYLKDGQYVHFSATDIYQRRANKPAGGMNAVDARSIASQGVTLEVLAPSQSMTDEGMDGATIAPYKHEVGAVFKVPNYLEIPSKDIDTVASVIQQTKKGVMVWFYFQYDEWDTRPHVVNPILNLGLPTTVRHSVTAVDYTLLADGRKALIIEDSWGPGAGAGGQRIVDEEFFSMRNWYAGNLVNFRFEDNSQPSPTNTPNKPIHTFNVDLEFGMVSSEVVALQDVLKYEGMFPANTQSSGNYGAITQKGVQQFQIKYGITTAGGPGYGRVGPLTRAHLNMFYGA